jgi:heme-degrading monooxygenase HmoA
MKTIRSEQGVTPFEATRSVLVLARALALPIAGSLLLAGCANRTIQEDTRQSALTTQTLALKLKPNDLRNSGLAFITPSSVTGQEEDKQALALAFTETLRSARPELRVMSLPETLSAVNRAAMTTEYKRMFEDYRTTGIFERDVLQKVAKVTGMRYLAQLKLSGFRQEAKGRWGFLGVRMLETKTSTIRIFFQIWDSEDGSVAWEGSQESSSSHESLAEEYVSLKRVVEESARDLVARLP